MSEYHSGKMVDLSTSELVLIRRWKRPDQPFPSTSSMYLYWFCSLSSTHSDQRKSFSNSAQTFGSSHWRALPRKAKSNHFWASAWAREARLATGPGRDGLSAGA